MQCPLLAQLLLLRHRYDLQMMVFIRAAEVEAGTRWSQHRTSMRAALNVAQEACGEEASMS